MAKITVESVILGTDQNKALAQLMRTVEKYIVTNPYFPHVSPDGVDKKHVRQAWEKYQATIT